MPCTAKPSKGLLLPLCEELLNRGADTMQNKPTDFPPGTQQKPFDWLFREPLCSMFLRKRGTWSPRALWGHLCSQHTPPGWLCPGRGKSWAGSPLPLPQSYKAQANWHPTNGDKTSLKVSICPTTLWKFENPAAFA